MNEKARALIDALKGVGISTTTYESEQNTVIEINRSQIRGENDHFTWCVGDGGGFAFVLDANGQIKEITE